MARLRTFYRTDGSSVRVTREEWQRRSKLQAAAIRRSGKTPWTNSKGRTYAVDADELLRRQAASERAKRVTRGDGGRYLPAAVITSGSLPVPTTTIYTTADAWRWSGDVRAAALGLRPPRDAVVTADLRLVYDVPGQPSRESDRRIVIGVWRGGELDESPGWRESLVREIQLGANLSPGPINQLVNEDDFGELLEGEIDLAGGDAGQGTNATGAVRGTAEAGGGVEWASE